MSAEKPYLVFGSDNSPYSCKVRAYFAFKGVPFRWIVRSQRNEAEYRKVARLAIVPAVRLPSGNAVFFSRGAFPFSLLPPAGFPFPLMVAVNLIFSPGVRSDIGLTSK